MEVIAEGLENLKLPEVGNAPTVVVPPVGGDEASLTEAQKLAAAEKIIADKNAADKAAQEAIEKDKVGQGLTDEQIQSKLDELAKKQDLTDEDKKFIDKFVPQESKTDEGVEAITKDFENTYGIKLEGKYEYNPDGIKAIVQDAAPVLAEKMLVEHLKSTPLAAEFYQHMKEGRGIETFLTKNTKPIFETIELKDPADIEDKVAKEKAISDNRAIISMNLKTKGLNESDINALIDLHDAKGILYEQGKLAKKELSDANKVRVDAQLQAETERIEAAKKSQIEIVNKAKEIITKNNFAGLQIPANDLKGFSDALFNTDKKGYSALDYLRENVSLEHNLIIDYIIYKQFKPLNLQPKQSNSTFTFKKGAEENKDRDAGKLTGASGGNSIDIKTFDFSTINKQ